MPLLKEHPPTPSRQVASHPARISWTNELRRKLIHLCSISIPVMYCFLTREEMLMILVPGFALSAIVEGLRFASADVNKLFLRIFGPILRTHELGTRPKITGGTWVLFSATLCVFAFPKVVAITGFLVLILSDIAAALIGRRFGRHRFLEKSVEGSSAFFIVGMIVVAVITVLFDAPWQFVVAGIVASAVSTVAEAMSYGVNVDDNVTIPLSFGVAMWGMLALMQSPHVRALLSIT